MVNDFRATAPAVFAEYPSPTVSDKYIFMPTYKIAEMFEEANYYMVDAKQGGKNRTEFGKHMVRFRHKKFKDSKMGEVPEILVVNGHNGRVALDFYAGLFKFICGNGLVRMSLNVGNMKAKHIHFDFDTLDSVIENFIETSEETFNRIDDYKHFNMTEDMKLDFASEAKSILWPKGNLIEPSTLIQPRRDEDGLDDIYTVYNVVQENAIRGGIEYQGAKRKVRTRAVKSIDRDLMVNIGLWQLMENYYER